MTCLALLTSFTVHGEEGQAKPAPLEHEFYFSRVIYGGDGDGDFGPRWAVDYPKADQQFLVALERLSSVDAYDGEHALNLDIERLHEFPFLYVLEVGSLTMSDTEREALRHYIQSGGFLVVDDFWGSWEWENFEAEMALLLPGRKLEEVPLEHPIFRAFYDISELVQVPNVYQGTTGGPTHEYDGIEPKAMGIFDDDGRLMVFVNWNTDLGDAWEWVDNPYYPIEYSNYAYQLAVNAIVYAMSH